MMSRFAAALELPLADLEPAWDRQYRERTAGKFATFSHALETALQDVGIVPDRSRVAAATEIRMEWVRSLALRPDALDTLAVLRNNGIQTALISNCGPDTVEVWDQTGRGSHLDVEVLSCRVGLIKPDPELFRIACQRLGVVPEECLYVADGEGGELRTAQSVGLHPVLIRSSYLDPPFFRQPHVEPWTGPEIASLRDVLELAAT